jgi:hypothetical protein
MLTAQDSGGAGFPFLIFYVCGVGKPRLSVLMTEFIIDSRDIHSAISPHAIDLWRTKVLRYTKKWDNHSM